MKEVVAKLEMIAENPILRNNIELAIEHYFRMLYNLGAINESGVILNKAPISRSCEDIEEEFHNLTVSSSIEVDTLFTYFSLDMKLYPIIREYLSKEFQLTIGFDKRTSPGIPDWAQAIDGSLIEDIYKSGVIPIVNFLGTCSDFLPDSTRDFVQSHLPHIDKISMLDTIVNDFQKQIFLKDLGLVFEREKILALLHKFNYIDDTTTKLITLHHFYCSLHEKFCCLSESETILMKISQSYYATLRSLFALKGREAIIERGFNKVVQLLKRDQILCESIIELAPHNKHNLDLLYLFIYLVSDKNKASRIINDVIARLGSSFPTGVYTNFPDKLKRDIFNEMYKNFLNDIDFLDTEPSFEVELICVHC